LALPDTLLLSWQDLPSAAYLFGYIDKRKTADLRMGPQLVCKVYVYKAVKGVS
jgi:hypothetical protein